MMTMNAVLERATKLVARLPPVAYRPRPAFDEVVALLREPAALFGVPSDRVSTCDGDKSSMDWEQVALDLHRVLREHHFRYSHVIQMLQIAAQVLRKHSLRICAGGPKVDMFPAEVGCVGMSYELRIDAPWAVANDLTNEYLWQACEMDLSCLGFAFSFEGWWVDEGKRGEDLAPMSIY